MFWQNGVVPIPHELKQDFFSAWSHEMAYVLGYFAADGSMIAHRNGGKYVEFTSTDLVLLENLKRVTGAGHCISERPMRNDNWSVKYRIQIGSAVWFQDLLALGFTPRKSWALPMPAVPVPYFGSFVRGYFDGDGCVYFAQLKYAGRRYKRWVLQTLFTSGSRDFLDSLHSRLKQHGVQKGQISTKTRGFELKLSHRDSLALYQLMYNTEQVSGLYLPRKREKLERAIQALGLDKIVCGCSSAG